MHPTTATIEPKTQAAAPTTRRQRRRPAKTRTFSATLLALLGAGDLWDGGDMRSNNIRPVFAMFAASQETMPPFLANLQRGNFAKLDTHLSPDYKTPNYRWAERLEFLRSARYRATLQTIDDDGQQLTVATLYLPDLFAFNPGFLPTDTITFIQHTPSWWLDQQRPALAADPEQRAGIMRHADRLALTTPQRPTASNPRLRDQPPPEPPLSEREVLDLTLTAIRFAGHIDKYTAKPIPREPEFCLHLYVRALQQDRIACLPAQYDTALPHRCYRAAQTIPAAAWGYANVNLAPPTIVATTANTLDAFLARQVADYDVLRRRAAAA